ncbi:MAG: hypothetical protein ABI207_04270 [Crocinitomicaceae bacterium]
MMKWVKGIFRFIGYLLLTVILYVLLIPFLWSPIYKFDPPKPFTGSHFYNPYQNMDSTKWFKANFHAHANVLGGVTNGRVNTARKIVDAYSQMGYKVHSVSNYMNINRLEKDSANFIPSYEHGYSPFKHHQVVIGAKKVFAFDFPLFQTLSNKQYIINHIKEGADIFAIAHPEFENSYDSVEITKLTGFRLIEVLNQRKNSFDRWDDALSAGNLCFIIGDDDVHDLYHHQDYGVSVTLVNAPVVNRVEVIKALKEGRTAGYEPWIPIGDSFERKVKDKNRIACFNSFTVSKDGSIEFTVNKPVRHWKVIGQAGAILYDTELDSIQTKFNWKFTPKDTYIRFNLDFKDGDKMYSNPVFRYDGKAIYFRTSQIDWLKTILYRGIIWLILLAGIYLLFRKRKTKKQ